VDFHFSEYGTYQELAPFEALDATRIAVAIIVIRHFHLRSNPTGVG